MGTPSIFFLPIKLNFAPLIVLLSRKKKKPKKKKLTKIFCKKKKINTQLGQPQMYYFEKKKKNLAKTQYVSANWLNGKAEAKLKSEILT